MLMSRVPRRPGPDHLTAVDIFNEGVDVPDVNILCFLRVTHSRRIFVQQLGRGLRISKDNEKVAGARLRLRHPAQSPRRWTSSGRSTA